MTRPLKVFLGSDHAGFSLKTQLLAQLTPTFPTMVFLDLGTTSESSVDYPLFAKRVADRVATEGNGRGILLCGSGIGVAIAANKCRGIRAATVWDETSARLSRLHNDANIVCFGARLLGAEVVFEAAKVWLTTDFAGGERHARRISEIASMEEGVRQ